MLVLVTQVDNLRGCWGLAKDSAVALGSFRVTGAPSKRSERSELGQMYAQFLLVGICTGLFWGTTGAHAQSAASGTQLLPAVVVSPPDTGG